MNLRYPAIVAAAAGAAMVESIGTGPPQPAHLVAQLWLFVVMLIVAGPYMAIAYRADRQTATARAFARGISITTAAIGLLTPVLFFVLFVSIMAGWAEHPRGLERVGRTIGAIALVPFGAAVNQLRPLGRVWGPRVILFVGANIWLAFSARSSRRERTALPAEDARKWRVVRWLGVASGVVLPLILVLGAKMYERL